MDSNFVTCEGVYFSNLPTAFQTDLDCEFCGLFNCWINYDLRDNDDNAVDNQTMISLSGAESFVANCVLHQQPLNSTPRGPANCTGILLTSNTGARFISDLHIDAFAVGIQITHSVDAVYCSNLKIDAYQNAVAIMPSSQPVYTVHFSSCTFGCVAGERPRPPGLRSGRTFELEADRRRYLLHLIRGLRMGQRWDRDRRWWGRRNHRESSVRSNGPVLPLIFYISALVSLSPVDRKSQSLALTAQVSINIITRGLRLNHCGIAISSTVADVSNVIIDGCNVIAEHHTNGLIITSF